MTGDDPERDERKLRALFDRTAETLDGPGLTKLRARAGDVPGARRRPWWWVFTPVAAVLAGALIVLVFRSTASNGAHVAEHDRPSPVGTSAPLAVASSAPSPPNVPEIAVPNADELDLEESEALADLGVMTDDDGNGGDILAALDEPADEDIDAWLEATGAFLEGG